MTAIEKKKIEIDDILQLDTGIITPYRIIKFMSRENQEENEKENELVCILGHGLGQNPKNKTHLDGGTSKIILSGLETSNLSFDVISYTARGHGECTGWQESAATDLGLFTWPNLAQDMIAVTNKFLYKSVILGGSSMGAATSFYAAAAHPDRIKALLLTIPPTGWEQRVAVRKNLQEEAEKVRLMNGEDDKFHLTLKGTADSDFPPLDDFSFYQRITCPVLILAVEGDPSHPVVSAHNLKERLRNSQLFISESYEKAAIEWPEVIASFMNEIAAQL